MSGRCPTRVAATSEEPRDDARAALEEAGLDYEELSDAAVLDRVAADLADGRIVGWFQGAFEMGPRALGNRSFLASPIRNDVRKFREPFRPFAPVVLEEFAAEYFEIDQPDPYMTLASRVREEKKALLPAAVHVDGTARIRTINRAANPRYYDLISAFAKLTGVPVLINTSFNKQEPIVARPREAVSCYLRTDMDVLVIGNLYTRSRSSTAEAQARQSFNLLDVNTHGGE